MKLHVITLVYCLIFNFSSVLCDLLEGADCISEEDGLRGTCADIRKCMQYVKTLQDKKRPQTCSFNINIPIVCCTDCELVNDTSNVVVNRNGLHFFETGRKAHDKCLEYVVDQPYPCHLWGGVQRYLDDEEGCHSYSLTSVLAAASKTDKTSTYPHMALLGYGNDQKKAQWLCAGTLISHRFVLTAAHCLYMSEGAVRYIALGLMNSAYDWEKYNVQSAIPHPDYKRSLKYANIALLESETRIKFTHFISPACLNTGDSDEDVALVTGWAGRRHRRGTTESLISVILSPYSESECTAHHPEHTDLIYGYNHTIQMCYGNRNYELNNICQLDIGGGLQVQSKLSSCTHTIIGVTSHGKPCSSSGIYTRVSYYVPWIESIAWN